MYLCGGYEEVRDYEIVIALLRGNVVEPVTPTTHHVHSGAIIISSYSMRRVQLLLRRRNSELGDKEREIIQKKEWMRWRR